ncbi:MAG: bifunctional nuclease family protein [Deltaproteobacteria bacterium]|nr:bifunctional nuclease family protein [Deltaproteobacteria bacterium]
MTKKSAREIQLWFHGLVLDTLTQAPVVLLRDESGQINIPIWIGMAEATSIATALKEIPSYRPLTHDFLKTVLTLLGGTVDNVCITKIEDGTFYAETRLKGKDDTTFVIDCRPSDAIALAVRVNCPIFVNEEVAKQSSVRLEPILSESEGGHESSEEKKESHEEDQAAETKFQTLQHLDKDKWKEILEKLSPDDFKHKH